MAKIFPRESVREDERKNNPDENSLKIFVALIYFYGCVLNKRCVALLCSAFSSLFIHLKSEFDDLKKITEVISIRKKTTK